MSQPTLHNEDMGTVEVEVIYLRGTCNGAAGWWHLDRCKDFRYSANGFISDAGFAPSPERARDGVFAFNDETCVGISGRDGEVIGDICDRDIVSFRVTAKLTRVVRDKAAAAPAHTAKRSKARAI